MPRLVICAQVLWPTRDRHRRLSGGEAAVFQLGLNGAWAEVLCAAGPEFRHQLGDHTAAAGVSLALKLVPQLGCVVTALVPARRRRMAQWTVRRDQRLFKKAISAAFSAASRFNPNS